MKISTMLAALVCGCVLATTTQAQESQVERGRMFAEVRCASCHAIGRVGESPLRTAPPFRQFHLRYPVRNLEESLAEGIVTAHPAMPAVQLDVAQIGDLIAYLESLER
jgi:mono/diheme cytochrome c family protein